MSRIRLLVAGVGGQGSIRASHIIARAAVNDGLKARVGETYGAAMRGGPVASHVKIGEGIYSPLNSRNGADAILSLEPMEGLRNAAEYLSGDGLFLTNTETWIPYDVNIGRAEYPPLEEITGAVGRITENVMKFDATSLAKKAGDIRTMNVVMVGALDSALNLPVRTETLKKTVRENVPEGTVDVNVNAFELGRKAV